MRPPIWRRAERAGVKTCAVRYGYGKPEELGGSCSPTTGFLIFASCYSD